MRGLVQMLVDAVFAVPLAGHRFPGTPAAACQGYYTVRCALDATEVQLALPAAVKVCTGALPPAPDGLLTMAHGTATAVLTRAQVKGYAKLDAGEEVPLFPVVAGGEQPAAALKAKLVYVKAALSSAGEVTVTFNQPAMGIRFPVHMRSGVVLDPLLVGTAQVLYHPQGLVEEGNRAVPLFTFELLPTLPVTWETSLKGEADVKKNNSAEEVLLHNVKFHFTEWEREQTPCTIVEQAGHTAVQFTETKDGITCRSLVLPRKDSILVVRCEIAASEWSANMPFMQSFFDTLYIDNVK
ncbi:hypothetical protein STCU_08423 [Strigomonas culicis]|uniref:Uncharacterized protein n=1 Tax=Strigomonas culicis TaxID=28005 RepID=S9V4V5_9TRYP|nr:hypothetical protein STCU_08423 [Strigomonas culicis]|eukprot:EPY21951.1 hypothetical protein STCU_08423 [Strigomonas culicis]